MRLFLSLGVMTFAAAALAAQSAGAGQVELKVGDMAPNFTLQASNGNTYTLAYFRGKQDVVLAWFPKALT
ncbi:MAG: peroxiredoxin, partial [Vicinamibacterales bacterium]